MIAFGASDMTKAYVGSTEVSKAYLGDELVWGGESVPSVTTYNQTGLIYMWDGIENAGYGQHTSDENSMVELINNNPATIDANAVWSSLRSQIDTNYSIDKLGIKNNTLNKFIDITFPFDFSGTEYTVEVAQTITSRRTSNVGDMVCPCPFSGTYEIHHYGNYMRWKGAGVREWNTSISVTVGKTGWAFTKNSSNKAIVYKNGVSQKTLTRNFPLSSSGSKIAFCSSGHVGTLHCIRIYNRALSATEIQQNWLIDKERFGL